MDESDKKIGVEADIDSLYEMIKEFSDRLSKMEERIEELSDKVPEEEDAEDLYDDAKETVLEYQKASTSFLQRKLRIGYSIAAQLIDMLEEEGIIGPAEGAVPRAILVQK